MQAPEIIKQKLEDFEKDIIAINSRDSNNIAQYKKITLDIYNFIVNNNVLNKEYTHRLDYDFKIYSDTYKLLDKLKQYSISFWVKEFKNKEIDYNDFLENTFSNYKCYINPDKRYKNYNSDNIVFIPKNFDEFLQVLNSNELWFLYDIEHEYFQDFDDFLDKDSWRLFPIINFAQITDENRLFGGKVTKKDEINRQNLEKYIHLTVEIPKELKIREFEIFNRLTGNCKEIFETYISDGIKYFKNISLEEITNCILTVVRELKYFIINSELRSEEARILEFKNKYKLSEREIEILLVIKKGLTRIEVANRLGIDETTVQSHIKNIKLKTGLKGIKDIRKFKIL